MKSHEVLLAQYARGLNEKKLIREIKEYIRDGKRSNNSGLFKIANIFMCELENRRVLSSVLFEHRKLIQEVLANK
jgi:hypothetical protein